jgi:signal transduction histidine kinase
MPFHPLSWLPTVATTSQEAAKKIAVSAASRMTIRLAVRGSIVLGDLETLVEQVREAGLPVELAVEGDARRLPLGVDLSAYRLVQEALTNALKHAGDARARVLVRYGENDLELEVVDDGPGDGGGAAGGHGLLGMRERVAVFGGQFNAGPRREGGYAVHARLPLGTPQ